MSLSKDRGMSIGKRLLVLFLLGFFLGPIGDYAHVVSQTTGYPQNKFVYYFLTLPFWVPFLFGTGTLLIGFNFPYFDRILGSSKERVGTKSLALVIVGLVFFLGTYMASGFLPLQTGGMLDVVLAALAILIWLALDATWQGILLGVMTAVVAALTEIELIKAGAFFYRERAANFYGVPTWLPWLYFSASVAVGNLGRYLVRPRATAPTVNPQS